MIKLTQQEIIEAIQEYAIANCNMTPPIGGKLVIRENGGNVELSAMIYEARETVKA